MMESLLSLFSDSQETQSEVVSADSQRVKHNSMVNSPDGFQFVVFDDERPDEQTEIRLTHILGFKAPHLITLQQDAKDNELVRERQQIDINNDRRGQKIFNEGVKYGAQAGLKSTIETFESAVEEMKFSLGEVWNFESVMIGEGKVHPPVISMSQNITSVNDERDEFSHISTRYETKKQARFEENPVSFLSYLTLSRQEIALPSIYSIPLDEVELTYWASGVYEGWKRGQKLAGRELDNAILKLRRDWLGIKRYEVLVKQNMISEPIVRRTGNEVEGYSDGMDLGIRILKIRSLPQFEKNTGKWNVLPMIDDLERKGVLSKTK